MLKTNKHLLYNYTWIGWILPGKGWGVLNCWSYEGILRRNQGTYKKRKVQVWYLSAEKSSLMSLRQILCDPAIHLLQKLWNSTYVYMEDFMLHHCALCSWARHFTLRASLHTRSINCNSCPKRLSGEPYDMLVGGGRWITWAWLEW